MSDRNLTDRLRALADGYATWEHHDIVSAAQTDLRAAADMIAALRAELDNANNLMAAMTSNTTILRADLDIARAQIAALLAIPGEYEHDHPNDGRFAVEMIRNRMAAVVERGGKP